MSEINSIANGSFVLGQTSATNFVAGPGIKIDEPSAGTVRIGNDETVLWESDVGATTANLSESVNNFEYIDFVVGHNESPNLYRVRVSVTGSVISISKWFMGGSSAGWIILATSVYEISNSGTTLSLGKGIHMWFSIDNFARGGTGSNGLWLKKVIGINRISGSNA